MQIVKLKYCDEFHCIGSECRDCCCRYWDITLTKREYLNYKKLDCSPKLRSVIDTSFERIKKGEDFRYAKVKFTENEECPLHDSDGLCMLQKEQGEKALTIICSVYPRLYENVGNEAFAYACDITCPHVAELLISHDEGLEISEEKYDRSISYLNRGVSSGGIVSKDWKGYPYFWTIKNAELDILQNRNFTVQERLLILGFFCKKADEYLENDEGQKIEGLYNTLLDNDLCKKIADSLKVSQSDGQAGAKSMDIFMNMLSITRTVQFNRLIKDIFEQAAQSLGVEITSQDGETISQYYKENYSKNVELFRKIESERPHILENILVNQAFIMSPSKGIFMNYFTLAVFYNNLKICVPAFLKEGYNDSDLALAFTYAAKMILNTHMADMGVFNSFVKNESYDLAHVAFLIS